MEVLRPGVTPVDLDGWFVKNFDPGIMAFLVQELGMTPPELAVEHRIWREHTSSATPEFYPGFLDALAAYRAQGGLVTVVSHSESDVIRRHYRAAGHPEPDLVFGWDVEPEHRKPSPWAVHEALRRLQLEPRDLLVVDDLRPGIQMARSAGVDAAAAGWAHDIPVIRDWMQQACVAYFATIGEFAEFVLR
ncbi:MAG: HAD family hydrolase [Thermoanaerobaculaceae bacterium]